MPSNGTSPRPLPENNDAPCNICGRGWPYHEDACAYKQTALENEGLRRALERVRNEAPDYIKALVRDV